jgi:uncharacterized protein (DUF4415 family)
MATRKSVGSSRPEKLVRKSGADIRAYVNSPEAKEHSARARSFGPDPTPADLEEIPELTEEELASMRPVKEVITMRVDKDVLAWFRRERHYQTRINHILRRVMEREQSGRK